MKYDFILKYEIIGAMHSEISSKQYEMQFFRTVTQPSRCFISVIG